MLKKRASLDRGHINHGWLDTYHTFSFADYHDPANVHFRTLRVINEDRVAGGQGFGMHPHRDMEIITYILSGALQHKDSMGNGDVIRPGDVQRMSAGTGVFHSEFNPSEGEPVHLLQIWIFPEKHGITPSYEQKHYDESERKDTLRLVASHDGRNGSTTINQDADVYASLLTNGSALQHAFGHGRGGFLQVARGAVTVNGESLQAGDSIEIENEPAITITSASNEQAEFLLFDLA
jgi:redox-sensitive bicupin YhaK (pirin superfamily)